MKQKQVKLLFSGILALVVVALYLSSIELEDASNRITSFPKSGSGFSSRQVQLTDFEKDILGGASAYKAVYVWKGIRYVITIVDGTHNRQAVHDPRYCFWGAGWTIVSEETIDFAGGNARLMELEQDGVKSETLCFYSDGKIAFGNQIEYWVRATVRRWLRNWRVSEPVLVMIQPVDSNITLRPIISEFLPLLPLP